MSVIKCILSSEFFGNEDFFLGRGKKDPEQEETDNIVNEIIEAVRGKGDEAVFHYSRLFEKAVPESFEISPEAAKEEWDRIKKDEAELASALSFAADNIRTFARFQKEQYQNFDREILPGITTGQRIIPVQSTAVYVPGGRYPLISSALMGLIPAGVAGVCERILCSPPGADGKPDRRILAAAHLAGATRYFAVGGAQAIASLALGTESIPKVDLIVGAGNKFVARAKSILYGVVGIDQIAGPSDLLVITDIALANISQTDIGQQIAEGAAEAAEMIALDMIAQAEHDPDARARVLVPDQIMADLISISLKNKLSSLTSPDIAIQSFQNGGLIIVYNSREEAIEIANRIAPEHLELHISSPVDWIGELRNYGSLFIGFPSGEVLGDYSAGVNHTLPTSGSARFTGGLFVGKFLKTLSTLSCTMDTGYFQALKAAKTIALAEGLEAHAQSAILRLGGTREGEIS